MKDKIFKFTKKHNLKCWLVGLFLIFLLLGGQKWETQKDFAMLADQFKSQARETTEFLWFAIDKLISEQGGEEVEPYVKSLAEHKGGSARIIHSVSVNVIKEDPEQQTIHPKEEKALLDGEKKEWETNDFLFFAYPFKATEFCQSCHFLTAKKEEVVPFRICSWPSGSKNSKNPN